jgi:hypothetical protein
LLSFIKFILIKSGKINLTDINYLNNKISL